MKQTSLLHKLNEYNLNLFLVRSIIIDNFQWNHGKIRKTNVSVLMLTKFSYEPLLIHHTLIFISSDRTSAENFLYRICSITKKPNHHNSCKTFTSTWRIPTLVKWTRINIFLFIIHCIQTNVLSFSKTKKKFWSNITNNKNLCFCCVFFLPMYTKYKTIE